MNVTITITIKIPVTKCHSTKHRSKPGPHTRSHTDPHLDTHNGPHIDSANVHTNVHTKVHSNVRLQDRGDTQMSGYRTAEIGHKT